MRKKITVDEIMALNPCYSRERVESLWAGRDAIDATEIAALEASALDRLWALIHACLDERSRRIFACDCADRAILRQREVGHEPDPRSLDAVSVSRRFAAGLVTRAELAASYSAAYSAASAYSPAHASASAYASAHAAYAAYARYAAHTYAAANYAAYAAAHAAASAARYAAHAYAAHAYAAAAFDAAKSAEREWQVARAVELAGK